MPSDVVADGAGLPAAFDDAGGDGDAALATLFDLLSDETRLRIVSALAAHEHAHPDDPALRFAALRERVDIRDSGRFNYHLRKLDAVLIEQCDAGYRLTPVGREIVALVSDIPLDPLSD